MITAWKKRINELKTLIQNKHTDIKQRKNKLHKLRTTSLKEAREVVGLTRDYYSTKFRSNAADVNQQLLEYSPYHQFVWNVEKWKSWKFDNTALEDKICVGHYLEQGVFSESAPYAVPAFAPFIKEGKTLILEGNKSNIQSANDLMQSLILRIALMLPHQIQFTFLDPSGYGKAFPIANQLPRREDEQDTFRTIEAILNDMKRIIMTNGLSDKVTFDSIAEDILINHSFEFIFAANFPQGYDRRTIEKLQDLANNGRVAGKHLIIHYNTDEELPRELSMSGFENALILPVQEKTHTLDGGRSYVFKPGSSPEPDLIKDLLEKLKKSKAPENIIEWERAINIDEGDWWTKSSIDYIETNIGRSSRSEKLNLWFGAKKNEDNRPCSHGVLGGMTGSGKSNLYHVLIMGLAVRYSPEELKLYLIDGKDGVELQAYKKLPHTELLSLKSLSQLSRSILTDLIEEKERRNDLFSSLNVSNFEDYRNASPNNKLPRILLLIDEYQDLFDEDRDGLASNALLSIAQQGRSAGIHMFLGSQSFGAVGMLHQQAIFDNIHLRVAMKLPLAARNALTEFGREGKQFIATCNTSGKIVLNDQSGDDGGNKLGKVAFLNAEVREHIINKLIEKAENSTIPSELLSTNVFNGSEQPNLLDNPQIDFLLRRSAWFSPTELEEFAKRDVFEGGMQISGWFSGEKPLAAWLGQEFNVKGYAKIIMKRRRGENVLIIGDRDDARYGMITSFLTSLSLISNPKAYRFYIIDRSIRGTAWSNSLKEVCDQVLLKVDVKTDYTTSDKKLASTLDEIILEISRRKELEEEERLSLPDIILLITEVDRIDALMQVSSKYSMEESELGAKLKRIYTEGSSLGIYTVLSFEGVMPMKKTIGLKSLEYFRHRVALQMSEDDSFNFVRKREPSRLQSQGMKPIRAYYIDTNSNRDSIFKPYVIGEILSQELAEIGETLKKRI